MCGNRIISMNCSIGLGTACFLYEINLVEYCKHLKIYESFVAYNTIAYTVFELCELSFFPVWWKAYHKLPNLI